MRRPTMMLVDLPPGQRFKTRAGRIGTLVRLTTGAALVRYEAATPHNLGDGTTLARPAETVTISRHTEVTAL